MTPTPFRLTAVLLCGAALAGCAATSAAQPPQAQAQAAPLPTSVNDGVRQAENLRRTGQYDAAIHLLSQLMLVAPDDQRVVGEYGKTLVEKGRGREAVDFLTRATVLAPTDWTLYSALGVAYDELGNETAARKAYEHALTLKPDDPSVLNNYALSRMMANDPAAARQLIARAASAGGSSDPKIARNIAMLERLAPPAAATPVEAAAAKPASPSVPTAAPVKAAQVSRAPIAPPHAITQLPPAGGTGNGTVVMEKVPFDPYAGPVARKSKGSGHKDRAVAAGTTHAPQAKTKTAHADKPAVDQVPALRMTADAKP